MSDFTLTRNSTNIVELSNFEDDVTRTRPTDATVTVTVKDAGGSPVTDATNVPMPWVAARRAYIGVLPSSVAWTAGAVYTEVITATVGTDVRTFVRTGTAADG